MITKDNIQTVLLELKFISNHGVYTRHFGSADEGFDLEYNFNVGEFIYPDGVQADRNTTQDEHQNESFVVFVFLAPWVPFRVTHILKAFFPRANTNWCI